MDETRVKATGEAAQSCDCSTSYFKLLAEELGLQATRLGSGDLVWTEEQVAQVRRLRERRRRNAETPQTTNQQSRVGGGAIMKSVKLHSTMEAAWDAGCSANQFLMLAGQLGLQAPRLGALGELAWSESDIEQVREITEGRAAARLTEGAQP